ncbi:C40 family peptidase [Pokkaliibacter sp. CJK22405]|uniref:C40 family peptidase n=1 Tax=Pokkaliibacter sp. CJK22405 TaxID=3384615 RepID=UPI003984761E
MKALFTQAWRCVGLIAVVLLAGCAGQSVKTAPKAAYSHGGLYEQVPLSPDEQISLIALAKTQVGKPYIWGAQTPERGFDCSGLLVWGYDRLGMGRFRYKDSTVNDVTADSLYKYNSYPLTDLVQLRQGDFIFFDPKNQGYETHVALFSHIDNLGRIWVWDASSSAGRTSQRPLPNFWNMRPVFGRPMKLIPATGERVAAGFRAGPVMVVN